MTTKKKTLSLQYALRNVFACGKGRLQRFGAAAALITLLVSAAPVQARQSTSAQDIDAKLALGESIKVTDHPQFLAILTELDAMQNSLTDKQAVHLKYLQAFRLAYSNDRRHAIELYKKVYESSDDQTLKYRALGSLIYNYGYMGDWEKGLNHIDLLLPALADINPMAERIRAHEVVINFYNNIGEYRMALQQLDNLYQLDLSDRKKCIANMLEVEALQELGMLSSRIAAAQNSISLCEANNDKIAANNIRVELADHFLKQDLPEQAMSVLDSQVADLDTINYPPLLASYLASVAQTHFDLNNTAQAEIYAREIVQDDRFSSYLPPRIRALRLLYQIEASNNNYESAFQYLLQYEHLHSVNLQREKARNLAVQQAKNDVINKNNQISLLNKENRLLQTEAELSRQEAYNHRLALALAVTLMVLLVLWAYRGKKLQQKFERLARNDSLTGVYNRGYFSELAHRAIKAAEPSYQPVSFILFDLDEFKSINDTYGHQTGDWVIRQAVIAARSMCRGNDILGRVGGEEFAIMLPGCGLDKATDLAEACRQAIAKIETPSSLTPFTVTASFGVTEAHSTGYSYEKLFAAADNALYQSKHRGRNRVFVSEPEHLAS